MALATAPLTQRRHLLGPSGAGSRTPRALVVHHADVVRAGVTSLLATGTGCDVTNVASVYEAFRVAGPLDPQVILFDFTRGDGAEACRLLAGLWPRPRLVALVGRDERVTAEECLAAGADAAVAIENVNRETFLHVVQRALAGTGPVSAGFRTAETRAVPERVDDSPVAGLTPREREMLYLIGEGLSNREIASALVLSVKTVEAHRANLGRKLNVQSRAGLMRLAMSTGLRSVRGAA